MLCIKYLSGKHSPLGSWGAKEYDIKYWKPKTMGELLFNYWD